MADGSGSIKKIQVRNASGHFTDTGSADQRLSGAWAYRSMMRVDGKVAPKPSTTTFSSSNEKKKK